MPGRDGTGPQGQGSRTGRGLGNCIPQEQLPSSSNQQKPRSSVGWFGNILGTGLGRGLRRGRRNRR